MFGKGSKIYSILTGCCPKCHEENMYKSNNFLKFWNVLKMNEYCSNCNLKYNMEPSFFFGAMFVSYALSVGVAIVTFLISVYVFNTTLKESFLYIILLLVVTMPLALRYSRNIWINIFVHFKK
jgi:uncharacterized protein (DUF983 family)